MTEFLSGRPPQMRRNLSSRDVIGLRALVDRIDATGIATPVLPAGERDRVGAEDCIDVISALTEPTEYGPYVGKNFYRDTFRSALLIGLAIGRTVFSEVRSIHDVLEGAIQQTIDPYALNTPVGEAEEDVVCDRAGPLICRRGENGLGLITGHEVDDFFVRVGEMCGSDAFKTHHMYGVGFGVSVYSQAAAEMDISGMRDEEAAISAGSVNIDEELRRFLEGN